MVGAGEEDAADVDWEVEGKEGSGREVLVQSFRHVLGDCDWYQGSAISPKLRPLILGRDPIHTTAMMDANQQPNFQAIADPLQQAGDGLAIAQVPTAMNDQLAQLRNDMNDQLTQLRNNVQQMGQRLENRIDGLTMEMRTR